MVKTHGRGGRDGNRVGPGGGTVTVGPLATPLASGSGAPALAEANVCVSSRDEQRTPTQIQGSSFCDSDETSTAVAVKGSFADARNDSQAVAVKDSDAEALDHCTAIATGEEQEQCP